ncbi:MAG: erythromycin esterase family protein [Janthinobacterium lividum]
MKSFFRSLLTTTFLTGASLAAHAQASPPAAATDTARITLTPSLINPVSLQSYEAFRAAVQPLIRQMAGKKVVAMGEGTHGTAEFYKVRFWLTRILVEEHGFDQLALENTYGDTYQLNEALQGTADFKPLMRKSLLSIWQNQEMAQVFTWMQARNRTHRHKVALTGIDAMFSSADVELLQKGLAATGRPDLQALTAQLRQSAQYKDSAWYQLSAPSYKLNRKKLFATAIAGHDAADRLLQALPNVKLSRQQRVVLTNAAANARMAFDDFYQVKVNKRESSRDSIFAEMTRLLVHGAGQRLIIWAHDAHVARHGVAPEDKGNGGGTGAFLERMFPGQYFVLATATAGGTFAATTQSFISPASLMAAYPLPQPKAGSWDASLAHVSSPNFYLFTAQLSQSSQLRPLRLTGQTIGSENFYADMKLSTAFDAVLFLRQTTAATPLP